MARYIAPSSTGLLPYGEKTRPGRCSEQELIAQQPSNQAREVSRQGSFPASFFLIVSPSPAVPSTFMPLPSRNTSAGRPVVLDTPLLPCSFLPSQGRPPVRVRHSANFSKVCASERCVEPSSRSH